MKVLDDKKTTWSLKIKCSSCKSELEIVATDVTYWHWAYFDESGIDYQVKCIACKQTVKLPSSKLPAWVTAQARKSD